MSARIFLEGGGSESKELHIRCREGFRRLLERCGFQGRMPRLVACGGRQSTFDHFRVSQRANAASGFVAMWVDSEESVQDVERTWAHLKQHDNWDRPAGAVDDQALFMTTCMETWIAADQATLRAHFGADLQQNAIPATDMESRSRQSIQQALAHATRDCRSPYAKGKQSFELLGKLNPDVLRQSLPSFRRIERILRTRL